jgi:hypothetical protein
MKNYVDRSTRWILRTRFCQGGMVDFSVLLEVREALGWQQVTRYSVAHANFHQYLPSRGRAHRHEFGPVDGQADVDRAYDIALRDGMDETEYWLEEWRRSR